MTAKRDYSCEIMALVVLTALSALSHFWYIMIAICVVAALIGAGFLLSRIFILAKRELLARLLNLASCKNAIPVGKGSVVGIARGARQSFHGA
jgi:hypothetical protein